jgi:XTP/dITP diphosphohydrolase
MGRRLSGCVVVATHNVGKLREIRGFLAPYDVTAVSAAELGLPEPEEHGASFAENAAIKARAAAVAARLPALADDSGLMADALGGAPGIHSARWAGPGRDFARAMRIVQERVEAAGGNRRASFVSALALAWPDGELVGVEGRVTGTLVWPPRGDRGFGYDPMFRPDGHDRTFGEMSAEEKHGLPPRGTGLSHRARAFLALAEKCLA